MPSCLLLFLTPCPLHCPHQVSSGLTADSRRLMAAAGPLPAPLTLQLQLLAWWASPMERQAADPMVELMTTTPNLVFDAQFREVCGCGKVWKVYNNVWSS